MNDNLHSDERAIMNVLARSHQSIRELGENPEVFLSTALSRLSIILGDREPDYVWAVVTSDMLKGEAGTLNAFVGRVVVSTPYGQTNSRGINIEPLDLADIDVKVGRGERTNRVPSGLHDITVTLNRDNDRDDIVLTAEAYENDDSVLALLKLVHTLTNQLV